MNDNQNNQDNLNSVVNQPADNVNLTSNQQPVQPSTQNFGGSVSEEQPQVTEINNSFMNQSVQSENNVPNMQPQQNPSYVRNSENVSQSFTPEMPKKKNSKLLMILGIAVGAIVLLLVLGNLGGKKGNNFKKVLSCDTHHDVMGLNYDENWTFYINDGETEIEYTKIFNFDKFHSGDYSTDTEKDAFAKEKIEEGEKACTSGTCTYSYNYKKGKKLEGSIRYSSSQALSLLGSGITKQTAEDIYNKLKSAMESGQLDGSVYTCK